MTRSLTSPVLLALLLGGCKLDSGLNPRGDDAASPDTGQLDSGDGPGGLAPGGGADDSGDPQTGDDSGEEPQADAPVRFLALGDGGQGNTEQYAVAAAMEAVCAAKGCDFAIYTGDNIYGDGITSVDDPQFEEKFEAPYANLDFPFYMSLGNHDWELGLSSARYEVEYTARSEKWTLPEQYHAFDKGNVSFFAIDSQPIRDGDVGPQEQWLSQVLPSSVGDWKIAFGHHPYVSNGEHGNTGGDFEAFFNANLCEKVDVYFGGHDHDLQWLQPQCGVEFIQTGAAASLRSIVGSNPTLFETATLGFMWVEIVGNTMTGTFYSVDGEELFTRTVTK